ncbi:MAG: peptidase domain-containing ABC transporter [Hyphomicrobiales bacterium]
MTTVPSNLSNADLGQFSVKELQDLAVSAFRNGDNKDRHARFEQISDALAAGSICGKPITGPAVAAMLLVLERLDWSVSIENMARSMPHFPEEFSVGELREVLGRLGFASEEHLLRPDEVEPSRLPGLVLDVETFPMVAVANAKGSIELIDPRTGDHRPLPSQPIRLVHFHAVVPTDDANRNKSWAARVARRFTSKLLFLLSLTFVINLMIIATSLSVMAIYDVVLPAQAMDTLLAIVIGVGIAFTAELWLRRIRAKMIGHLAGRLEYIIGTNIFAKLMALPVSSLTSVPLSSQISRLKQFETVRDLVAGPLVTVGLELPFVLMFASVLFLVGGPLGFIPIALIAVYAVIAWVMFPHVRRLSAESSEERSEQHHMVLDTLANLRTIRRLGCEDLWLERVGQATARAARTKRRAQEANRVLTSLSAATIPITGGATVLLGAHLVMNEVLTVGALIACMIVIWRVITPIQQGMLLLSRYADLARLVGQIDRLFKLPEEKTNDNLKGASIKGAVKFERTTFRYAGSTEPTLLNLMIDIEPGELVAVSGTSGAGKSTLLRLVLNLYQPQSGSVSVDGMNVRQLPVSVLRSTIGYVPQQPALFHGTLSQNLRLAAPAATDDDLHAVADELDMLATIQTLPRGFHSRLDEFEQGHMAQGIRQGLAIMQAFLRRPKILLMDEPIKGLDPQVEKAFVEAIERRRGQVTSIMVTHRPSHIQLADRSLVLARGQIAHNGPPQQMPAKVPA